MRNNLAKHDSGFTLLEVMISTMILAVISLSVYQATTQTYKVRERLVQDGDFYNGIRLAMSIIDRDVMSLFSPTSFKPNTNTNTRRTSTTDPQGSDPTPRPRQSSRAKALTPQELEKLKTLQESELGQVSDYWMGATDLSSVRISRFTGTDSKIQLITSAHRRLYKGSTESEFSKTIYELREDPNPEKIAGTKVLVKVNDPIFIDDKENQEKTEKTFPLLTGVKSFKIRYFRADKRSWERKWDTSLDDMKDRYPDLVEVALEVVGQSDRKLEFTGTYIFKPEMPLYGLETTY